MCSQGPACAFTPLEIITLRKELLDEKQQKRILMVTIHSLEEKLAESNGDVRKAIKESEVIAAERDLAIRASQEQVTTFMTIIIIILI